ncbi:unnamed protein product [Hydatigera taeniaeformis]|uniref:Secreted protein n=1 Tax=Hydatigena taeniaeformis TaxID=6205 RepID=A0A0R3XCB5_HYDTA|nr:unnamed protein product [Hydatigera taeniaeformis]
MHHNSTLARLQRSALLLPFFSFHRSSFHLHLTLISSSHPTSSSPPPSSSPSPSTTASPHIVHFAGATSSYRRRTFGRVATTREE